LLNLPSSPENKATKIQVSKLSQSEILIPDFFSFIFVLIPLARIGSPEYWKIDRHTMAEIGQNTAERDSRGIGQATEIGKLFSCWP
jgi:hypothetical protein